MLNENSLTGKAVVIGAGTMGGGIAAQLANAGWQVHLLDMPGANATNPKERNAVALAGLERVRKNRPPLLFLPEFANRILVGNTEDDLTALADADWIVEAVAERMEIKQAVMAQIARHCGSHTVISSNTSGLSLREMSANENLDFRRRFLGTHFLNPPRYLKLLEVVALPDTDPQVAGGFLRFAEQVLGHRVVRAKDTPGFISTRIWISHLMDSIHTAVESEITVEEVDYLTGAFLGRPKSATFRMADIVGLDIIAAIARNQHDSLPEDPLRSRLVLPDVMQRLIAEGRIGDKSGAGFYRREGREILALDFATLTYRPRQEPRIEEVESLRLLPLAERFKAVCLMTANEPWRQYLREILMGLCSYLDDIAPEIAEDVLAVDHVMQWGFGWEMGPFSMQDTRREARGGEVSYEGTGANRLMRIFGQSALQPVPMTPDYIVLSELKEANQTVLDSPEGSLIDLGDGIVCLEYHTKMNTFNPELCAFVNRARECAERDFRGMVVGNQAEHFSAGYNLRLFLEAMATADWETIDRRLYEVQYAFMGLKYASVPVVAAPHGYTLGAGCEGALHCSAIQAGPELVMGLPELAVGVLPAGGGTKEMLARAMADWDEKSDPFPFVEKSFDLIALAQRNSQNGVDAQKMGFLRPTDGVSHNADRRLYDAKQHAIALAEAGYTPPERRGVWVLGEGGLARLRMRLHNTHAAGLLTDHDRLIADTIAFILSGGKLPFAQTVSEDYLLRLEREQFLLLAREPQSAERMRHVLETGKPLKN